MVIVMLTQDRLKELVSYNPETGIFTWVSRPTNRVKIGSAAGCPDKDGYILIGIAGKIYKAHRLAFLYMDGLMPEHDVDHINGVKSDNSWSNIRRATRSQNNINRKGTKGYYWSKSNGHYRSNISINGKTVDLGGFDNEQDARQAYLDAATRHYGEFINTN